MRRLLVALYPEGWRARYRDEFLAVLGQRALGPHDIADVLLGALDAHLHPATHGLTARGFAGGTSALRIGGLAAVVAGIGWLAVLTANAINDGREAAVPWLGIVLVATSLTTLVALIGLSAFEARRHPVQAWAAFTVPALGAATFIAGGVASVVIGDADRVVVAGLSGWLIATLGLLLQVIGSSLFALATWHSRSLSRGAAALLGVGTVVVVVLLTGRTGGETQAELSAFVVVASILPFPLGWAALGISAIRLDRRVAALSSVVPA